jgi:hypothetical protein
MDKIKILILAIIFLILLVLGGYFYKKANDLSKDPQAVVLKETEDLVSQVSKLILLPKGEVPTIATVSDPDKLKDQEFFNKAKKGDKVLLYQGAKKAYLYDPVLNKVIEVSSINFGSNISQ